MTRRMRTAEEQIQDYADHGLKLRPARNLSTIAEVLWERSAKNGDYVTAMSAGITAAAAYLAKETAYAAWVKVRDIWAAAAWAIEDVDRPLAEVMQSREDPFDEHRDRDDKGTIEEALDRLVSEVNALGPENLDELTALLPRIGDKTVSERLSRIRRCEEWGNLRGIVPPSVCVALCRCLLVDTPLYVDQRDTLTNIDRLANQARDLTREFEVLGFTPGLSEQQHWALLALLGRFASWDSAASGTKKPIRHRLDTAPRVHTVRVIAGWLLPYMGKPRSTAIKNTNARAIEIAALATAAWGKHVTPKDVRGALKGWTGD